MYMYMTLVATADEKYASEGDQNDKCFETLLTHSCV